MTRPKIVATALIVIACVAGILLVRKQKAEISQQLIVQKPEADKTWGDPAAPIQIIEYSDFQCPACANGARIVKTYTRRYPENFYIEFRHYPIIKSHPLAMRAAMYAECAARQQKFWPFHDILFAENRSWHLADDPEPDFRSFAIIVGLHEDQLDSCLGEEGLEKVIISEKAQGFYSGVQATPTYIMNKKILVGSNNLQDEIQLILRLKRLAAEQP